MKKEKKIIICLLAAVLALIFLVVVNGSLPFAKVIMKCYLVGYPMICIGLSLYIVCFFQNFTTWEKSRLILPFIVCAVNFLFSGEVNCMNLELVRADFIGSYVESGAQRESAHSVEYAANVRHAPRVANAAPRIIKVLQVFRKADGVLLSDMRMDEDRYYTAVYIHPSLVVPFGKKSPSVEFLDSLPK